MRTRAAANRTRNRSSAKVEVSGHVDAREFGARRDPELEVHVGQVVADGAGADQQLCRDLPIRQPTGGKPGDTQLLGGQAGRVFVAARIAGQVELALRPGMQKSRTDPVERARGGAEVLGRYDCGQVTVGKRADLALWDVSGIDSAGSWDRAALLLAGPQRVRHLFVEGRQVVRDGLLATIDLDATISRQNTLALQLSQ